MVRGVAARSHVIATPLASLLLFIPAVGATARISAGEEGRHEDHSRSLSALLTEVKGHGKVDGVHVAAMMQSTLEVAVAIAYTYGWRMQSEVLTLQRRQLDLEVGTLRLEPGTTKNDEGRVVYLTPELKAQLAAQVARVEALQRRRGQIIPFLFPHLGKGRRAGRRRADFRKAWTTACEKAGVPGMHRHDFRRTAVRNMVNKGVLERVAMKITGLKTRAVFDRYHIVSPGDLQDAARKLAGTIPGTVTPTAVDTPHVTS